MALTFQIVYTIRDDDGDTSTTAINIPTTFSLTQYAEFGGAMAELIDAIVGGVVQSAELSIDVDISGLTSNALVFDSDVEELGAFEFATGAGRRVKLNIPALDEALVLAGTDELDTGDAAIAAVIAAMEDGLTITGAVVVQPTDVDGDDIASTIFSREEFRSSGVRR